MAVRPTLREDLSLPVPSAQMTLDQIDHPLLAKAGEQFAQADTPHERIRSIDDVVLFKVKAGRWRGMDRRKALADARLDQGAVAAGPVRAALRYLAVHLRVPLPRA
jgi:hypothetical protein